MLGIGAASIIGVVAYGVATDPMPVLARVLVLVGAVALCLGIGFTHGSVVLVGTRLRLALWPMWWRNLDIADITGMRRVELDPLRQTGNLGLNYQGGGRWMLALRRGSGLELTMVNGKRYAVGVEGVDELQRAIRAARR